MIKTGVSLFAGIGGFDLAMERAGINVVATVEWDKHAQGVLARRFPNSKLYGDITGVTGEQLISAGFDPANGIITGGFPCQDLSVAGRRAGLTGSRSGLFWEICRLLDETKAQSFILENVPGLLSSNEGRDMGTVIRALEERGYSVAWRVLDAQHFGVAQRRRRVFIIGHLGNDWRTPAKILAIAESSARYSEQSNTKRKETSGIIGNGIADDSRAGNFELYDFPKESISPTLNARRAHDTMTYQEVARMQGFRDYQIDEIAGSSPGGMGMINRSVVRRLTPIECERLQGFPDNWTEGQADSHRYKQLGNAVAVPVVEWIIRRFITATN